MIRLMIVAHNIRTAHIKTWDRIWIWAALAWITVRRFAARRRPALRRLWLHTRIMGHHILEWAIRVAVVTRQRWAIRRGER